MAGTTSTSSLAPSTTTDNSISNEGPAILKTATYVAICVSMSADLLSIFACTLSVITFAHLRFSSPVYIQLLILASFELIQSSFDTIEYVWRLLSPHGLHETIYYVDIWSDVIYPIAYIVYLVNVWLVVLVVLERWCKNSGVAPWSSMTALRASAAVLVLSIAVGIVNFFQKSYYTDEVAMHRLFIYFICQIVMAYWIIPFAMILGFAAFTTFRYLNKPYSHRTQEEISERQRTKAALLMAVCFVFMNSLAYPGYIFIVFDETGSMDWETYKLLYELHIMLSSLNVLLETAYYLAFLADYRRTFLATLCKLLSFCGLGRFLSNQHRSDRLVYSGLEAGNDE